VSCVLNWRQRRGHHFTHYENHVSIIITAFADLRSPGRCGRTGQRSPRFKARVACFNGKLDSRSSCAGTNFQPDGSLHPTGKMSCGFPGKVSEIEWSFVERRGNKDVYRFTRRFPSDSGAASTTSKSVEFSESRVVVFEDKFQAVVIEPPGK
jgi:hypothetical protein